MKQHTFHTIDGKAIAEEILLELRKKILASGKTPGLAVILVGENPSSRLYVKNKKKASEKVGIAFHQYECNGTASINISENEIVEMIRFLNRDPEIDGIVIQLPLPEGLNTQRIINAIDPAKDVDGFHPDNIENLAHKTIRRIPPLIKTILHILKHEGVAVEGQHVVIISRSEIFSPCIQSILEKGGAGVTITVPNNKDFEKQLRQADIIISIIGVPGSIKGEMIKENAVIIDVGITQTPEGFKGDADLESVKKVAKAVTPVPGGVGPVTVAMLLDSVFEMAREQEI